MGDGLNERRWKRRSYRCQLDKLVWKYRSNGLGKLAQGHWLNRVGEAVLIEQWLQAVLRARCWLAPPGPVEEGREEGVNPAGKERGLVIPDSRACWRSNC